MFPDSRQDQRRFTLAGLLLLCSAGTAWCQTSANLTLVSAYTARGVALNPHPALQLRVEHDLEAGWYAGGFASPARLDNRGQDQLVAYGGRAQRITSTLTWDAGVSRSAFLRGARFNYTEFYAGLASGRSSARLFYSPAYYGEGRTVYLDLGTAYPLGDRVSLALHAGLLHPFGEYGDVHDANEARDAGDVRISLATSIGDVRLQAGWQGKWHPYLPGAAPARALTASASIHF
jgi:uncharacterized protein (TIGR02001 family)